MVRDRLAEFLQQANISNDVSVEVENHVAGSRDDLVIQLLDKLSPLYETLKDIDRKVKALKGMIYERGKKRMLEAEVLDIRDKARQLYHAINELKQYKEKDSILGHIAATHHLSLSLYFSEAIKELSSLQVVMEENHLQYVRKELMITGQLFSEEELVNLLDQESPFTHNFLQEEKLAKDQLQDLQDRHDEVIKLEKSIEELAKLFLDLEILVKDQGEKVDRIERYVYDAKEEVEKGAVELKEAKQKQTQARKKKFIIYVVIILIVLIIILSIVFSNP